MRLTTKGRYAVTAILDIALHAEDGPVSVHDIAQRQGISSSYLEQLVGRLKRAGLLASHRGPGGGYVLGKPSEQISVSEIVASVGEGVDATRCGGRADCHEGHTCLTHNLWADLSAQIDNFLQRITLAQLVARDDIALVSQRLDRQSEQQAAQQKGGSSDSRIAATQL